MADSLALAYDDRIFNYEAPSQTTWKEEAVLRVVSQLRGAFTSCFDNTVSAVIINELPTDFKTLRYIRNMIAVRYVNNQTRSVIEAGLFELERLLKTVNTYFLPRAKELMHVSYLKPSQLVAGRDVYVLRRLALTVLPSNLERLEDLAKELKLVISLLD